MERKSFFEKVQLRLADNESPISSSNISQVAGVTQDQVADGPNSEPVTQPTGIEEAALCFDLNANQSPHGHSPDDKEAIPPGARIRFRSPLFGDIEAIVIEARGVVVWIWHPEKSCEACIPRHWVEAVMA